MYRFLVLVVLAVLQVVGAVPIDAAETATDHQDLMMDNGTLVPVQLPPGITFVPQPDHSKSAPGIMKRANWYPGNNNICGPPHAAEVTEKTKKASPWVKDCRKLLANTLRPENQGHYVARWGVDFMRKRAWWKPKFSLKDWSFHVRDTKKYGRLMSWGTCVFGVKTNDRYGAKVGTHDISEAISVVMELSHGDRMQWEGKFRCKDSVDNHNTVRWAIFHT